MDGNTDYTSWSNDQLISRVTELEAHLRKQNATASRNASLKAAARLPTRALRKPQKDRGRTFDPSRYSTRMIALKFAYLGQRYNGFEHHANNKTRLPTIEEVLWTALTKTKLILPTRLGELEEGEVDWNGCDYSKCGRTDKGVSAFGQVVGIRVRSRRPPEKQDDGETPEADEEIDSGASSEAETPTRKPPFDPIRDELPYIQLLNRVLPEDIRILAWCPSVPENFSARFSCRERRYRYFFTQPAYAPVPGSRGLIRSENGQVRREGWLDIEAMQDAASRYEGLHDFRNFCKVDPSKQITNFERRIFHSSINAVDPTSGPVGYVAQSQFSQGDSNGSLDNDSGGLKNKGNGPPALYYFEVRGSAFLWHQVRHLVAVLFLVGQGLESPSIVSDLLDMAKTPTRPKYEMAVDAPLVLWDCVFPAEGSSDRQDGLYWIYLGDEGGREQNKKTELDGGDGKFGRNGGMDSLWAQWHQRKIEEVLAGSLLDVVAYQGRQVGLPGRPKPSPRVTDGGNTPRAVGTYVPIMQKDRMEPVDVINARYLERRAAAGKDQEDQMADVDE